MKMTHNKMLMLSIISHAKLLPLAVFFAVLGFSIMSCDDHEVVDTSVHIGYILCDDNSCMDSASYFAQDKRKAVGVVFFEKNDTLPAMAVMLNEKKGPFSDTIPYSFGTSTDIEACVGRTNTVSLSTGGDDKGHGSPIGRETLTSHVGGQSEYIPSVKEMRLLSKSARTINPIIKRLGGTPVALSGDCWYWTSTEVDGNDNYQAWLCSAPNGSILEALKLKAYKVRTIIQINYPE